MSEPAPSTLFICYAKEDHAFACEIFTALRKNGIHAWMARPPEPFALEGILPGQDSALQIERRLSEADGGVVILSPASIAQQGFVQSEFRMALHAAGRRELPIVAVLQEACTAPAFAAGGIALDTLEWIDHSAKDLGAVIAAIKQNVAPRQPPPTRAKKSAAIAHPTICWRAFVGRLHWRNTIHAENGRLYLTSCGARWNQDDRGDGVYCLDAESGALRWSCNTAGDVNEALVHGDTIVAGTDAGQLALIDKETGALKSDHRVWHPIFARPFTLRADGGARIFAISHKGMVLMVEPGAGTIAEVTTLPFLLRANPAVSADERSAILFGETGEIARAWSDASSPFQFELLATKSYFRKGAHTARRNAGLVAAPVLDGTSVIGVATRDTYYSAPALFRFDMARKKFLWGEREEEPRAEDNPFGNLRNRPLVIGNDVIFAPAYAAALYGADKETGEILWKIPVGQELLQQWSSPVQVDERRVLLARADGILYQIDIAARKIEWALSLLVTPSEMQAANRAGKLGPGPSEAAHNGITATPAWHDGRIFLGTTEGELFCVEDAG